MAYISVSMHPEEKKLAPATKMGSGIMAMQPILVEVRSGKKCNVL